MRKEVKLGMTLGGGAAALLVGYLLVAPPANNKKGAQFVGGGGGNGSIIDNSQPGDLSAGGGGGTDEKQPKSDAAQAAPANTGASAGNIEQPKAPADAVAGKVEEKTAGKPTGDQWGVLNSGKQPKAGAARDSQAGQAQPHEKSSSPAENRVASRGSRAKTDAPSGPVADAHPTQLRPREEGNLYFNPKEAWGGGLSTDAARLASNGVRHGGAKATVVDGPVEQPKAGGTHVVQSGETFSSIAAVAYGSASYYPHLVRANPHANPNNLKLGTVITIPPIDQVKATGGSGEHAAAGGVGSANVPQDVKIDPARQYKVVSGDSLYKISMKVYGKSGYTDRIYEANKALIGPNPTKLKVGMILELPDKAGTIASNTEVPTEAGVTQENEVK